MLLINKFSIVVNNCPISYFIGEQLSGEVLSGEQLFSEQLSMLLGLHINVGPFTDRTFKYSRVTTNY